MPKNLIPLNTKKNLVLPPIKNVPEKNVKPIKKPAQIIEIPVPVPPKENPPEKKLKRITAEELTKKKEMGQFYTTDSKLQENALNFIKNKPDRILEPSTGRGDLILPVMKKFPKATFDLYEIDEKLEFKVPNINFCNFLETNINRLYDTIIGNPPFVKTKKGNLAIDFVQKCFGLLDKNGELIFIVPADFFKLTSTANLLNEMMEIGTITDIYHPSEENLFEYANINIMLFRYCKNSSLPKKCNYNGIVKKIINNNGTLIFADEGISIIKTFGDYFDIHVGLVSGLDNIFKNEMGNIDVLNAKEHYDRFIYYKTYPTQNQAIDNYLQSHKSELMGRGIRKFNEDNWFEWGAPRNVETMEKYKGKDCIYLHNLTRKEEVAFGGKVEYFGGNLLILIPKEGMDLREVVDYLNSQEFKKNYIYAGRFKIGQRQISNALFYK